MFFVIVVDTCGSSDTRKYIKPHGATAIKLHGRVTHFIPPLTGKYTNGIEYFAFHDLDSAVITDVPINVEKKMKPDVFKFLVQEFKKTNRYVQKCIAAGDLQLNFRNEQEISITQVGHHSTEHEVSCISTNKPTGNRGFIALFDEMNPDQIYSDGATWNYNSALSDKLETLSYLMLFQNGESGWGWEDRKQIDIRRYVASRMLRPERDNTGELLSTWNLNKTKKVLYNRFNICCTVAQYYVVNQCSRMIDFQLDFIKKMNQEDFFGDEINLEVENIEATDLNNEVCVNNDNSSNNDSNSINIDSLDDFSGVSHNSNNYNNNVSNSINIDLLVDFRGLSHAHTMFDNTTTPTTAATTTTTNNNNNNNNNSSDNNVDVDGLEEQIAGIFEDRFDENNNLNDNVIDDYDESDCDESNDDNNDGPSEKDKKKVFLSESVHGGFLHLRKCSQNGLSILSHYGSPTCFLTVTVNPRWKEILEKILPNQTAQERIDITNMVFKQKLCTLENNLNAGKYFNGQVPVYKIHVIEFQERGLPHAHIVFRLSDHPKNEAESLQFIKDYIRTDRVFDTHEYEKYTDEENEEYLSKVEAYMKHT